MIGSVAVGANVVTSEQRETAAASIVNARLGLPPRNLSRTEWPVFAQWCEMKGLPSSPARPATVAFFVIDRAPLGISRLLAVLESVSAMHEGRADPTLGRVVAAAIHHVAPIERPRSWSKDDEDDWKALPRARQQKIAAREQARDLEMRRAQSEAGTARTELKRLKEKHGTPTTPAESAARVA
jgi:hypothetical protein